MYCTLSDLLAVETLQILVQLTVDDNDGVIQTIRQPIANYVVVDGYITDKSVKRADNSRTLKKVSTEPLANEYRVDEVTGAYTFNADDIIEGFEIVISWQQLDFSVVDQAIASSENIINGYIGARYTVPLTPDIPLLIVDICVQLTIFKLYQRRRRLKMSESLEKSYKDAIKMLVDISKGVVIIPELTPADEVDTSEVLSTSRTKIYTQSYLDSY